MRERPILMKGPLVVATLDDRKTQTRRICKAACERGVWADGAHPARDGMPIFWWNIVGGAMNGRAAFTQQAYATGMPCPYGGVGDHLWVREGWAPTMFYEPCPVIYRADHPDATHVPEQYGRPWKPSIHMPRWASRLTLEITGVRVERLQDISEADAIAEGIKRTPMRASSSLIAHYIGEYPPLQHWPTGVEAFANLWDTTTTANPAHRWAANPYVWRIVYRRISPAVS